MIIMGWVLASVGATGTVSAVILDIISREPVFMLMMKLTTGIFGVGGIIIGIKTLGK